MDKNNNFNNLFMLKFQEISSKIEQFQNGSIDFGASFKISHKDVHLLTFFYENSDKKASELAKLLKITKGALSHHLKKFQEKGLISRETKKDNYKEIFINLTPLGLKVHEKHMEYHMKLDKPFVKLFSEYNNSEKEFVLKFLWDTDKILDDFNKIAEEKK